MSRQRAIFGAVVSIGLALRLWFVFGTPGTPDVTYWAGHAKGLDTLGLTYYRTSWFVNHPPAALFGVHALWRLATWSGVPFRIVLRLPIVLADLASALLLLRGLGDARLGRRAAAAFWLAPLAIVLSSYHGNTDSLLGTFALASAVAMGRGWPGLAGLALGAGAGVKVAIMIALPALLRGVPETGPRVRFWAGVFAASALAFAPALLMDDRAGLDRVFGYGGITLRTLSGQWVWGVQVFDAPLAAIGLGPVTALYDRLHRGVALGAVVAFAVIDPRPARDPVALARRVGASFLIFYGLTNSLSFQYFAWCAPFLAVMAAPFRWGLATMLGAYVWCVYAFLCDDVWLRGRWDFEGHPIWPTALVVLRNASLLACLACAVGFLVLATRRRIVWWKTRRVRERGCEVR